MRKLIRLRDLLLGIDKLEKSNKKLEESNLFKIKELKAFEVLKPYFPEGYLFESSFSMSFQAIQHILNDIFIYKPERILEFGSGLSTQIISNFLLENKLTTKLYSVDDDGEWQSMLNVSNPNVTLSSFSLVQDSPYSYQEKGKWFDIPENHELTQLNFDLVIVDAPKKSVCKYSRYGFIPFLKGKISKNAIIYVDDSNRPDEQQIVEWAKEHFPTINTSKFHQRYTRISGEEAFSTRPS